MLTSGKEYVIIIIEEMFYGGKAMKRKTATLSLFTLTAAILFLLCSCEGIGYDPPAVTTEPYTGLVMLTPEEENEIIDTFLHNANRDEKLEYSVRCFWKSENAYAALVDGESVIATETHEIINGYRFEYPEMKVINIFCSGKVYALTSALDNGIITEDDIRIIYEAYDANIKYQKEEK